MIFVLIACGKGVETGGSDAKQIVAVGGAAPAAPAAAGAAADKGAGVVLKQQEIDLNTFTVGDYFSADLKTREGVVKPIYEAVGESLAKSLQAALDRKEKDKEVDQALALKTVEELKSNFDSHKLANLIMASQGTPGTLLKNVIGAYFDGEVTARVTAARAARGVH